MDYARRRKLKQLIDELDDAQFDRLVEAVRASDLQLPGWRDRLAPGEPSETGERGRVAFSVDLTDLVRGVELSGLGASSFGARAGQGYGSRPRLAGWCFPAPVTAMPFLRAVCDCGGPRDRFR